MITGNKSKSWKTLSWITATVLTVPVAVVLWAGLSASGDLFGHLWQTVLPHYILNTIQLAITVVVLALVFGVPAAALISHTNILGKRYFRWLLMLPLAMPAYLVAYLYTDLFDYAGPVQRFLRELFNWQSPADYWFFDIRTVTGAGVMLALVLFPYVYMLARTAFETQDVNLNRASRTLGLSTKQTFFRITLPLARPAIAISATLVLMETLADFATVQYFAVNTLTTAIYDTWLGYSDLATANALASVLMLFVLFTVIAEQKARSSQRHQSNRVNRQLTVVPLGISGQCFAVAFCGLLVIAGFLLPLAMLLMMAIEYAETSQLDALLSYGMNSVEVSFYAATITTVIAILLALFKRLHASRLSGVPLQVSGFGYAVPGTVLAMAMLATFGPVDHWINNIAAALSWQEPGLILSGTIFAIVFALVVRFSAIANGSIVSGLAQVPRSIDQAPQSLGVPLRRSILTVHVPILRSAIFSAWLLVFVESMKELPAVLLLRPFNFETLATSIYQLISDEMLEQGALGALLIVVFGLIPIIYLNKSENKG